jgi:hypothetical protein
VPLSEEELRLLEQMERALVEEDPKFASTLRGTSFRRSARRRAIVAGIAFVLGVAILMAGAVLRVSLLGVGGFVVMLLSATVGLTAVRGHAHQSTSTDSDDEGEGGAGARRGRRPRQSFMERLEDRWRRRREGF